MPKPKAQVAQLGGGAMTPSTRLFVVPGGGIEPPRPCGHQILSLARLPSSAIPAVPPSLEGASGRVKDR
jgi:hypothetical protein